MKKEIKITALLISLLLSFTSSMNAGQTITVDSQKGWQEYEFATPVSSVTGITGGWTVDKNIYTLVGAHGHQGKAAQAMKHWKQYKFDQKYPFGALMVDLGSTGRSKHLTGPIKFDKKITKLRIRINDKAFTDNKGKLVVTFE